jgi:plasmid stability protein
MCIYQLGGINMDIRIRNVDPELHKALKMKCVEKGESIQAVMIRLISEYVKGQNHGQSTNT